MEFFEYISVFLLGSIVGSFLNVVLYRIHTGKTLGGRSHCMSCLSTLRWYELLPVVSYLVQKGRCRTCSSYIPVRYFLVEILTGLLYVLMWFIFSSNLFLFGLNAILSSLFVLILVYDIAHAIIPDELTYAVFGVAFVSLLYGYIVDPDITRILSHGLAGTFGALFFFSLWHISKGRWIGLGDAKLALPLGLIVGAAGTFSMIVLSFWIGALLSLSLLGLERLTKRGKIRLHFLATPLTIKSEVPFAPFLILGFLFVHIFHANIFTITSALLFGE